MKKYFNNISIEFLSAWILAIIWISPLLYAFWAAFHPQEYAIHFKILAPLTLSNFIEAWNQVPFARYFLNTFLIVSSFNPNSFARSSISSPADKVGTT